AIIELDIFDIDIIIGQSYKVLPSLSSLRHL
ncbi:hypothetical protein JL09_g6747, partial [Pichia kudriavzevii]